MPRQRVGYWLFEVPDDASARVDSDASHHFETGSRYIYAVSNKVGAPSGKATNAAALHAAMSRSDWSYELNGGRDGYGWAKTLPFEDGWYFLQTTRESDGFVLSCTISFRVETDLEWALKTWREIRWSPV